MTGRAITCHRCQGSGEVFQAESERFRRCGTCRGHGTIDVHCKIVRPRLRIEEPTPMASVIHDSAGNALDI